MNGLAVFGNATGIVIDIEVTAMKSASGKGTIKITGIVEGRDGYKGPETEKNKLSQGPVENVLTVLKKFMDIDAKEYDIHLNFPGGIPIDGPSAGIAIAAAVYSAILNIPVSNDIAMTGELSIRGKVKPVGGVAAKVEAAKLAGINKVLVPRENWQEMFSDIGIEVLPVDDIVQVISHTFYPGACKQEEMPVQKPSVPVLAASPAVEKSF